MLVNIFNKGMIPWIKREGPIYGLEVSNGLLSLLSADPRIDMKLTTREEAIRLATAAKEERLAAERKAAEEKEKAEQLKVQDEVKIQKVETPAEGPVVETEVSTDNADDEIDSILEQESTAETSAFEQSSESGDKIKKYTEEELSQMTKAQMKAILIERGYTSGPYAGKYHDTLADLVQKVLKTQ